VERAQRKYKQRMVQRPKKSAVNFFKVFKTLFDRITMRPQKKFVFINLRIKKKLDGPTDFFTDEEVTPNDGMKGNNKETN
jgi:hypothetical protein